MNVKVTKDNVSILNKDELKVHVGEYKVNLINFDFSEEYTKDLVLNALFVMNDGSSFQTSILDNECHIPGQVLESKGHVLLGVYAYKVNEDELELRYSPRPDYFNVELGSYNPDAEESQEITPTQFEQYMQALNDGLNQVKNSISELNQATDNANDLVDEINTKLENGDFIGPQGPTGPQGEPGKDGTNGIDGVGITTITSGQATEENGNTITPITVEKTDGSSETFNVSAKNGIDGKNGQNGKDGINGTNGIDGQDGITPNIQIGTVETLEPTEQASVTRTGTDEEPLLNFGIPKGDKGDPGETPDLSNYVQYDNYAVSNKGGVIKGNLNGFNVDSSGTPSANVYTKETYDSGNESIFISKGTLENIKNDYVGTSEPINVLNDNLDNIVPKQTATDSIINVNDALKYKAFDFKVDGAYKQTTSDGSNLLDIDYSTNPILGERGDIQASLNDDYSFTVTGNKTDAEWSNIYFDLLTDINIKAGTQYYLHDITLVLLDSELQFVKNMAGDFIADADYIVKRGYYTSNKQGDINEVIHPYLGTVPYDESKYYKYTGGNPSPNPNYPQEIITLSFDKIMKFGKNMLNVHLDETTSFGVTMNVDNQFIHINGKTSNEGGFRIITNTCLLPAGTYSINVQVVEGEVESTNNGYLFGIYKGTSWDVCAFLTINNVSKKANLSFTLDEPTEVCLGLYVRDSETYNNVKIAYQLTLGTEPDYEFEPYQGNDYSIDLQGNEIVALPNGVKDELQIDKEGNVNLIKRVGKVIYDGSDDENWAIDDTTSGITQFSAYANDCYYEQSQRITTISNYFNGIGFQDSWTYDNCVTVTYLNKIRIMTSLYTTVEEFRNWLSTHNTIVYYQLLTPKTINLGKLSDLITTENGSNTFAINGNIDTQISTTYALDIKKYIDNKIATVSTAVIGE